MMFQEPLAVRSALRRTAANLWTAMVHLVYERTILVLLVLFCVALLGSVWHLQRLYTDLVDSTALEEAARYTDALAEFRTLYTREVVETVRAQNIVVTHDYDEGENKGKAIPLPATLSMLIGNQMAERELGGQTALYSAYPFPWRKKEWQERDQFAKNAWEALTKNPDEAFHRIEDRDGRRWLRYATADLMRQACVKCHNEHPDTPRRDWKEGDVRGVLEVSLPLDTAIALTRSRLQGGFALIAFVGVAGLSSLALAVGRLRRDRDELEGRVQRRTAALAKTNTELETEAAERKRAEQVLRDSEEKFRGLLESAPDPIVTIDRDGRIVLINEQTEEVFGYTQEELIGQTVEVLLPQRFRETHVRDRADYFASPAVKRMEQRNVQVLTGRRKDGTEFPAAINLSPLKTATGVLATASVRDMTEQQQAEEALRASEERFHKIFERSNDAILLVDPSRDEILDVNSRACGMLKYSHDELLSLHMSAIHPNEMPQLRTFIESVFQEGSGWTDELTCTTKTGDVLPAEISASVIEIDGKTYLLALVRDITERKQAEQALREAAEELTRSNKELERFAYVASHDLQQPLRTVTGFCQLLKRRYHGQFDAEADEFIDHVVDGATGMQGLINDLLTYSRVGTGGKPFEATDCAAVVDQTLENLEWAVEEAGAVVTRDALPTLPADAAQLGQLFQNLIDNGIKFHGDAPPRIHVSAERNGGQWIFTVRDNGIGIDPKHAERIFAVFQRLHGPDEHPGSGIGLAVCKKIVERHGGRIWTESELGHGTTFYFTLSAVGTNDDGKEGKTETDPEKPRQTD